MVSIFRSVVAVFDLRATPLEYDRDGDVDSSF